MTSAPIPPSGATRAGNRAGGDPVRVGVAGWSYADWRGTFYPAARSGDFSELRFTAERFDTVEINASFYRPPPSRRVETWCKTVEDLPGFLFTAKLDRRITHERPVPRDVPALARPFLEGMRPLVEAGRLGAVLVQFPRSFRDEPQARDLLRAIADTLSPLPVAVEVRHPSFLGRHAGGALPFLGELGLNFVNIDLPRSRTGPPPTCITTGPVGYVRLHGRNRPAWFSREATRDEKYDYLYSAEELQGIHELACRLAQRTERTFVIANNHFRGQAPANARQLIELRGRGVPQRSDERELPFLDGVERSPETGR